MSQPNYTMLIPTMLCIFVGMGTDLQFATSNPTDPLIRLWLSAHVNTNFPLLTNGAGVLRCQRSLSCQFTLNDGSCWWATDNMKTAPVIWKQCQSATNRSSATVKKRNRGGVKFSVFLVSRNGNESPDSPGLKFNHTSWDGTRSTETRPATSPIPIPCRDKPVSLPLPSPPLPSARFISHPHI